MTKLHQTDNCFFKKQIFFVCAIICLSISFAGCKYNGIVTLQEQTAIFQNLGFQLLPITDSQTNLKNVTIQTDTAPQVNETLKNYNIKSTVLNINLLYLQTNEANVDCLIYLYTFKSHEHATNFYNYFLSYHPNSLFVFEKTVIQKGISKYIANGSTNYFYFSKFCNGLKQ